MNHRPQKQEFNPENWNFNHDFGFEPFMILSRFPKSWPMQLKTMNWIPENWNSVHDFGYEPFMILSRSPKCFECFGRVVIVAPSDQLVWCFIILLLNFIRFIHSAVSRMDQFDQWWSSSAPPVIAHTTGPWWWSVQQSVHSSSNNNRSWTEPEFAAHTRKADTSDTAHYTSDDRFYGA